MRAGNFPSILILMEDGVRGARKSSSPLSTLAFVIDSRARICLTDDLFSIHGQFDEAAAVATA